MTPTANHTAIKMNGLVKLGRKRQQLCAQGACVMWSLVVCIIVQLAANFSPESSNLITDLRKFKYASNTINSQHQSYATSDGTSVCQVTNAIASSRVKFVQQGETICTSSETSVPSSIEKVQKYARMAYEFTDHLHRSLFGPKVLVVEAIGYQQQMNKDVIVLNSTNFNTELIQFENSFPHIKLIEYYLPYCSICMKFKQTYNQLAKDIHSWRNVIRLSAIDLGVSKNSPIAHSWSINVVPTLRAHPPPCKSAAEKLSKQFATLSSNSKLTHGELQKTMYNEYNAAKLMINSLDVSNYTSDGTKEMVTEKAAMLKRDLLRYIERYVSQQQEDLPATWPNLRPVTETSLKELRANHPRHELFLFVDATTETVPHNTTEATSKSDQSSLMTSQSSLGLNVVLEMSSDAAREAVRYVRASENLALVVDIIRTKEKEASGLSSSESRYQLKLLQNIVDKKRTNNDSVDNFLLIHMDDSQPQHGGFESTFKFPFITIVTSSDLILAEKSTHLEQNNNDKDILRAKRTTIRARRSASSDVEFDKLSLQRKIELVTLYIKQAYTETKSDNEFVKALNTFDEDPTSLIINRAVVEKYPSLSEAAPNMLSATNSAPTNDANITIKNKKFLGLFKRPRCGETSLLTSISGDSSCSDDYEDKLKAIRYIFFREVPRRRTMDKSSSEQQEKLNTLLNLVTVIKAYFPLPDAASIQFIDGVHNYLLKQHQTAQPLNVASHQDNTTTDVGTIFDTQAFKRELKRLELEGKRLPEIKEWKMCKSTESYACAFWRLFHTLTAFEYKKLSQINQVSSIQPQHAASRLHPAPSSFQIQHEHNKSFDDVYEPTVANVAPQTGEPGSITQNGSLSLVEHVVSPPSTTTSLSLTIATPTFSNSENGKNQNNIRITSEADLPPPVLLVMRDYVSHFYSCVECSRNFEQETSELSYERIRHKEPADFSVLWLWQVHNRISKRLSVDPSSYSPESPKNWFPTHDLCKKCYRKPPSYLLAEDVEPQDIFRESIDWVMEEIVAFLIREYTRQPMDKSNNLFGYQVPYGSEYMVVICFSFLMLIVLLRCLSCYIERQRRHKANLLNGNGIHYSVAAQRS